MREFAVNAAVSSFCNMISISDSLIIGSDDPDLFIKQISNFVSEAFIEYSEPFREPFTDILAVESNTGFTVTPESTGQPHKAFPILFRGGIAFGSDVTFYKEGGIFEKKYHRNGKNVCGLSYVKAVKLEKSGKGPGLFCNKEFVDSLTKEGQSAIRHIKDDLYEVVWTYYACEAIKRDRTNPNENIKNRINDLLVVAINLYNYYFKNQDRSKEDGEQEYKHYEEFILLICRGMMKYACDNKVDTELTFEMLNKKLKDLTGNGVSFDKKDLDSFIL